MPVLFKIIPVPVVEPETTLNVPTVVPGNDPAYNDPPFNLISVDEFVVVRFAPDC